MPDHGHALATIFLHFIFVEMPKYIVRHGVMRHLGIFSTRGSDIYRRSDRVIARTNRGLEVGEVLCEATNHSLDCLENFHHGKPLEKGQILHRQSDEDAYEAQKLYEQERSEYLVCLEYIAQSGLEMHLVDVEHLYGGERIVVYYLSDSRVDFRQLVKQLAKEFQTRIEMRQIGVRDEAKLLADYGDCGQPVCCNNHLMEMSPVSMQMAKLQKATLDPSKISGRCGRLKCCLRYEYSTYQELKKDLPPVGSEIITKVGRATVLSHEILANKLLVYDEGMRRTVIDAKDVITVIAQKRTNSGDSSGGDSSGEPNNKKPI